MATVLVVDDDAGIRESAAMALEKVGLKTLQAGDTVEALQLLRDVREEAAVLRRCRLPGESSARLSPEPWLRSRGFPHRRRPPAPSPLHRSCFEVRHLARKGDLKS